MHLMVEKGASKNTVSNYRREAERYSAWLKEAGIGSLDELPPLAPYLPDAAIIDELVEQGHG